MEKKHNISVLRTEIDKHKLWTSELYQIEYKKYKIIIFWTFCKTNKIHDKPFSCICSNDCTNKL